MAKVLDTAELLEHILSFLPLKKLVGKQRVCKSWKALIETSPTLRRLCFLDSDLREIKYIEDVYPTWSPLDFTTTEDIIENTHNWPIRTRHPLLTHMFNPGIPGYTSRGSLTEIDEVMRVLSWPRG